MTLNKEVNSKSKTEIAEKVFQTGETGRIFEGILNRGMLRKIEDTARRVPTTGLVSVVGVQRDKPFTEKITALTCHISGLFQSSQITNHKQAPMTKIQNPKHYETVRAQSAVPLPSNVKKAWNLAGDGLKPTPTLNLFGIWCGTPTGCFEFVIF